MREIPRFVFWKKRLEKSGFKVLTPKLVDQRLRRFGRQRVLTLKAIENRKHFGNIGRSDAILVLNYSRGNSKNYVGGSTFAEISVAFYLRKPIFLVNPIPPNSAFREELEAWKVRRWKSGVRLDRPKR